MASKKELIQDIKAQFGGASFVNANQAGQILNMGRDKRAEFLASANISVYITGKEKKFAIIDLVDLMDSKRTYIPFGDM